MDIMLAGAAGRRLGLCHLDTNRFAILDDGQHSDLSHSSLVSQGVGPLLELASNNQRARALTSRRDSVSADIRKHLHSSVGALVAKSLSAKPASQGIQRRKPIEPTTFEPPAYLQQTLTWDQDNRQTSPYREATKSDATTDTCLSSLPDYQLENHPLVYALPDDSIEIQISNHLAGQFDWLISYPAVTPATVHGASHPDNGSKTVANSDRKTVFGCNLLTRETRAGTNAVNVEHSVANRYTFLATPLEGGDAHYRLSHIAQGSEGQEGEANMALHQQASFLQQSAGKNEIARQKVSPCAMPSSERSNSFLNQSSRGSSFSHALIEDSLEEIDRLEDQLEAVTAATGSEHRPSEQKRSAIPNTHASSSDKKDKAAKRVTISIGQSATVRLRPKEKVRPALRRASSLTLRENASVLDPVQEQKAIIPITKAKPSSTRPPAIRTPVKSTKALTIPSKYELPGEAVAKRLKEQREARQAQQAEAQRAAAAPIKTRSTKPLTKPTFELPGEAISRRKREEREAKRRAQEEEERKRREFKARPIMHNASANYSVRDTFASRARQGKMTEEPLLEEIDVRRSKRLSTPAGYPTLHPVTTFVASLPFRGRNPVILPVADANRGNSSSTAASTSGLRSSLSFEDAAHQKVRGKEVFLRDNSLTSIRERERRERETATKLAREQAAERSRAASREWAEKKRQKEQRERLQQEINRVRKQQTSTS